MSKKGRPSLYNDKLAAEILDRLADGETLTDICKSPNMPCRRVVIRWRRKHPDFGLEYAQAREDQQHAFADEIISRSKDESRDYYTDDKGVRRSDNTAVQRDKLICDNLKFLMARLASADYGERVKQELTGKDGEALSIIVNVRGKQDSNT